MTRPCNKISREAAQAFVSRQDFRRDNTEVKGGMLFLYGNCIARWGGETLTLDTLCIRDCKWPTNTTKARLNAILRLVNGGVLFHQDRELRFERAGSADSEPFPCGFDWTEV